MTRIIYGHERNLTGDEYGADGGGFAIEFNWMVNMVMGGQLNVIGLMYNAAFLLTILICWPCCGGLLFCAAEFVIQLIALLLGSHCLLDHNDFWLRALVIYWDYFL